MVIENCKFKKMSMRYTAENWLIEQMDFVGKIMLSCSFHLTKVLQIFSIYTTKWLLVVQRFYGKFG